MGGFMPYNVVINLIKKQNVVFNAVYVLIESLILIVAIVGVQNVLTFKRDL